MQSYRQSTELAAIRSSCSITKIEDFRFKNTKKKVEAHSI